MAVYVSNLTVNTGATFNQTFTLEDSNSNSVLNLTGYTVRAQMRKHPGSSTFTDLNFSFCFIREKLCVKC